MDSSPRAAGADRCAAGECTIACMRFPDPASRRSRPSRRAVSPDARRVAFAAVETRAARWRIWIVDLEGRGLERALPDPAGPAGLDSAGADDFDPCWVDDTTLCFASTRAGERAQYGGVPAS